MFGNGSAKALEKIQKTLDMHTGALKAILNFLARAENEDRAKVLEFIHALQKSSEELKTAVKTVKG